MPRLQHGRFAWDSDSAQLDRRQHFNATHAASSWTRPKLCTIVDAMVANAAVANVFMDRMAPWTLRKTDPAKAQSSLNTLCEWISWVARWMVPFMPGKAQELWEMLGRTGRVMDQEWPGVPEPARWRTP